MREQGNARENQWARLQRFHAENPLAAIRVQVTDYLPDPQSAIFIYPTKHTLDWLVMILCAPHFAAAILTLLPYAKRFSVDEPLPRNPNFELAPRSYIRYRGEGR